MWPDYEKLEEICSTYQKSAYEKGLIIKEQEESIKTIKDKIEFLTKCLDDRDKSIELLKEERDKWRGKYNRLKSEFNLLKNKRWHEKMKKN